MILLNKNNKPQAPMCPRCDVRHYEQQTCIGYGGPGQPQMKRDRRPSTAMAQGDDQFMVTVKGCRCRKKKCGHEWVPRDPTKKPGTCPKCKSRTWSKP